MADFPQLPLWTDAYLADTTHLTTAEHGAYLLLLMAAWRSPDGMLPNDDAFLGKVVRDPKNWPRWKAAIMPMWGERDGKIFQKRLLSEREFVLAKTAKQAKAGRASALKRWGQGVTDPSPGDNGGTTPTPTPTPNSNSPPNGGVSSEASDDPPPPPSSPQPEPPADGPPKVVREAFEIWNEVAKPAGLPVHRTLPDAWAKKLRNTLRDQFKNDLGKWRSYCEHIARTPFTTGKNDRGWMAHLEWAARQDSVEKMRAGFYGSLRNG